MKRLVGMFVRRSGMGTLLRWVFARRCVTIVVYHDPAPEVMHAHLAWYARRYSFITRDALASALDTGAWHALPRYPLVVTLDDGHRGNAALEPVFRAWGVRPTIFLCSRIVGTQRPFWWKTPAARQLGVRRLKRVSDDKRRRMLTQAGSDPDADTDAPQALGWEQVLALADVADFGAHTRAHPILPSCDDRRSAEEIELSGSELSAALGRPCRHFAYPNGDFGRRELAAVRRAGYRTARSATPGWNGPGTDPARLRAIPVSDDSPPDWLAVQVTGIPACWNRLKWAALRQP